jgi:pantetheine-phosphate adenylyltransferase
MMAALCASPPLTGRRQMTIALYPGTFNPIHNGHTDLLKRAAAIFPRVILGIAHSPQKKPADLEARVALAQEVVAGMPNIEVCGFSGLTVEFAREHGATVILKGIRTVTDFEYEFQMLSMNRALLPGLETVFLAPSENCSYISSTLIRQISQLGGDVSQFVHPAVERALRLGLLGP